MKAKYEALAPMLNERTRRLWAAAEAEAIGHGGITRVARATGMSRSRIARGIHELKSNDSLDPGRIRRPGGGRKRLVDTDETLLSDLNALLVSVPVEAFPGNYRPGEPKSIRMLTAGLRSLGHSVSRRLVDELLQEVGYTLKPRRKVRQFVRKPPS